MLIQRKEHYIMSCLKTLRIYVISTNLDKKDIAFLHTSSICFLLLPPLLFSQKLGSQVQNIILKLPQRFFQYSTTARQQKALEMYCIKKTESMRTFPHNITSIISSSKELWFRKFQINKPWDHC